MKKLSIFLIIVLVGVLCGYGLYQFNPNLLGADSGFDADYGGGGGSSGGGSYGGGGSGSSSKTNGEFKRTEVREYLLKHFENFSHDDVENLLNLMEVAYCMSQIIMLGLFAGFGTFYYFNKALPKNFKKWVVSGIYVILTLVAFSQGFFISSSILLIYCVFERLIGKVKANEILKYGFLGLGLIIVIANGEEPMSIIIAAIINFVFYTYVNVIKQVVSDKDLSKYVSNKDEFLKDRFNDYVVVQEAWMNFDYKTLKDKLTNELYNQYEMQLETLKTKNEKNIMKDIKYTDSYVVKLTEENDVVSMSIILVVEQKDYIEKDGKCVRGDSSKINYMKYRITYISNLKDVKKKCPNCGNSLKDVAGQTCPSCRSVITFTPKKWVMAKKEVIEQR